MHLFVLTGATVPFTALVEALDSQTVTRLRKIGFEDITIQYGHARQPFEDGPGKLGVKGFDFQPDVVKYVRSADVVVSHAGTGSILDVLRKGRPATPLVVVVNESLMDNHQMDVANKLKDTQLLLATPETLVEVLEQALKHKFEPLPPPTVLQSLLEHEAAIAGRQ